MKIYNPTIVLIRLCHLNLMGYLIQKMLKNNNDGQAFSIPTQ